MKEDPQSVVIEAGEATARTLDLLHAQVEAFGRTVRGAGPVVVQDLGAPTLKGGAERTDLFDLVALAPDNGLVEKHSGNLRILGQVDVAHRLLGQPGTEELVVGIAVAQSEQHALMTAFVETLVAGQEELADPIDIPRF